MGAADDDQMNETVVHRHVRGEVVALRRRVLDLPVVSHSLLHSCARSGTRGLAQLPREGNGASGRHPIVASSRSFATWLRRGLVEADARKRRGLPIADASN